MPLRILVVDDDKTLQLLLRIELGAAGFEVTAAPDGQTALELALEVRPDLILLDNMMPGLSGLDVLSQLRARPQTANVPVILLTGKPQEAAEADALRGGADHYMTKPFEIETLVARVEAVAARAGDARDVSPLTGLPGNARIQRELDARLLSGEPLALVYADIDFFKAFNDRYGFMRGDEVIKFCAMILIVAAADVDPDDAFVGHVGGDDFVVIVHADKLEQYCKTALDRYDEGILEFYDPEDAAAGHISVEDRNGVVHDHPVCSLSMGVATNLHRELTSPAEASTIASEMKHFAKMHQGSNYQVDRRVS